MEITVEYTAENGVSRRLHITGAPKGTERVVLDQFIDGPGATLQMIQEATDEPTEVQKTLRSIQETIDQQKQKEFRPAQIGDRSQIQADRQRADAARRIEETKKMRAVNSINAAALDCLNFLNAGKANQPNE